MSVSLPDELVVIEEGGVFDEAEVLLHPVDKGLDLQVGHFVQREEADAAKDVQQVTGLQVESLQVLEEEDKKTWRWRELLYNICHGGPNSLRIFYLFFVPCRRTFQASE